MPRTKSRTSSTATKKSRTPRGSSARVTVNRSDENALRRYIDFVRAVLGASRNGR